MTLEVIDGTSGEVGQAQLIVAAFGASNLGYAEATWVQTAVFLRNGQVTLLAERLFTNVA